MKSLRNLILFCAAIVCVGCNAGTESTDVVKPGASNDSPRGPGESNANNQVDPNASGNAQGGGSGGVAPMAGMGAGGLTPVSGSESLQGGGSGVGQAAKDRAKQVAGSSPSSINSANDDE